MVDFNCTGHDTTGICSQLESTGDGLGMLLQRLGASLPQLLLILAIVGGVAYIFYAIAHKIAGGIGGHGRHM